jgi:hypothetical protein
MPSKPQTAVADGVPSDGDSSRRSVSLLMTSDFAFLHVPRTGGRFLRKLCFEHMPATSFIPNDLPRDLRFQDLADDFSDLPMFAIVRNPWDWYVSWYHNMTQVRPQQRSGPIWETGFSRGESDFATTVRRACTGEGFESPRTSRLMSSLGVDHYTALHTWITGGGSSRTEVEILRFELLRDDFEAFLSRHEVPVDERFLEALHSDPPVGASDRRPYSEYYDDELRELVRERAAPIVAAHGYEF